MSDIAAVESQAVEKLVPIYKEIIRVSRTLSQLEELTENQLKSRNISSYKELIIEKNKVQKTLSRLQTENSVVVSFRRLARFDDKSGTIVYGHMANPERTKFAWENIPNIGRGFLIELVDKNKGSSTVCFDFDNSKDITFINKNISKLNKEMLKIDTRANVNVAITMEGQEIYI